MILEALDKKIEEILSGDIIQRQGSIIAGITEMLTKSTLQFKDDADRVYYKLYLSEYLLTLSKSFMMSAKEEPKYSELKKLDGPKIM